MKLKHIAGVFIALLLAKFLWPLFRFDIPMGYDPGIYRYLFIQYEQALTTFSLPELLPWAGEHPPGLFLVGAVLMKLGASVDSLLGIFWNLTPIALAGVLAWVTGKRLGVKTGVLVLLVAVLSQAYFDGFYAMYFKAYIALLFVCLTYFFVDKFSPWFLLTALLTVVIHHQTGMVMAIALGVWWIAKFPSQRNCKAYQLYSLGIVCIAALGLLVYLPHFERVFWSPFKSIFLLRGDNAPAGAFPEASFYLRTMPVLLSLGVIGFVRSLRREVGSVWQLSVVVCAVFIVFRLVFYKRFFLHLDFFLLPFAAEGLLWIWERVRLKYTRGLIVLLLLAQAAVSWKTMMIRVPQLPLSALQEIVALEEVLPEGATVIALENVSGMWLLGWLPHHTVGAPGMFDVPDWTYEDWEIFIDGTTSERKLLLNAIHGEVYFYANALFTSYYGERAESVLADPCLKKVPNTSLVRSSCSGS
jgi:hypothetical protein